ncbi:MAG TPA: pectin acetylesterase-family hydrolase [Gemmatimonadota bacterium]|nr:pectin acetylesterase-family hydrolase [Gemmatimonadota bacterium]
MIERREWPCGTSRWVLTALLLIGLAAQAQAQGDHRASGGALPSVSELEEGWNTLHPAGETTCAHGDEFLFYARAADPARLVVYLYGGGGCWDAETCDPDRETYTYTATIDPARHPGTSSGIFDLDHPDNPVADYSMVAVPVCTGDAYLGDRDVTYALETESGETRHFTINHRGQTNTMAVMDWIRANFEAPREIFVAGSSAGSVGTPFYANLLAQHYPAARVVGLGDDTGSFGSDAGSGADPGQWGVPEVLRRHSGWEAFEGAAGVDQLYTHAAHTAPNLRLYQFDHAHDATQRFYLELADAEDPDVLGQIRANRRIIREQVPEFRSFTVGGFQHTVLRDDRFYLYRSNGHRLRDWVAAIVAGEPVASVDCGDDCLRPGLVYGQQDLATIDRAIELLSAPGAWNPGDAPGPCPPQADRYTLRCAAVQAEREVTGRTPVGVQDVPPALWDVVYTAALRLGDRRMNDPLRRYNDHPETTAADMISLLEEVRERIRGSLPSISEP